MLHIIIENEEAYQFSRKGEFLLDGVVWYTTSPLLLEKLPSLRERVLSLEEGVSINTHRQLGLASIDFATKMASYLNETSFPFFDGLLPGKALQAAMQLTMFVFLYKAMLLEKWYSTYGRDSNALLVVGNPELSPCLDFSLVVGRFDTLFAVIASRCKFDGAKVILHKASSSADENIRKMRNIGSSRLERRIAFLNQTLSEAIFKCARLLQKNQNMKNFRRNEKPTVFFQKNCELMTESFLTLFIKGVRVIDVGDILNGIKLKKQEVDIGQVNLEEKTAAFLRESFARYNERYTDIYDKVGGIFSERLFLALRYGADFIRFLSSRHALLKKYARANFVVATNAMTSPAQRLWQQYLVKKRVPIFTFEHGVTAGMEGVTRYLHARNVYSEGGDYMVCYSETSKNVYTASRNEREGIVAGAPFVTKKMRFYTIQRRQVRDYLKIKPHERLIVYLPRATRNNMIVGPETQNDLDYYLRTKTIACDVFGAVKDPCILKLYPTIRYLDPDPFTDLVKYPPNVKVVQYLEFRYLRAAADVIILNTAQSTLGWAWSCGVPIIFIELPSTPLMPDVVEMFDASLFRVDGAKDNWAEEIKRLLNLPSDILLRMWQKKGPDRKKMEELYLFGPPGNSGKRAAEYILKKSLAFMQRYEKK